MGDQEERQERRRGPQDMQALLKFCTEITAGEDTTNSSSFTEMDQERKEFLENAVANMQLGVAKVLAESLNTLNNFCAGNDIQLEDMEIAFENLDEYCEDVNYATDIHKLGGFHVMVNCLDSEHSSARHNGANVIANLCQNNEYCQKHMLETSPTLMQKLIELLNEDQDEKVRVKSLFAISCLTREFKEGENLFLENDGLNALMNAMTSDIEKLIIKSCFLLSYLITRDVSCRDDILRMGYVEQVIIILHKQDITDICREQCTRVLADLATGMPSVLNECLRPEFGLVSYFNNRLQDIEGNPEYQDEEEQLNILLNLCSKGGDSEER